jgi:AraC-like DNA-binding protein
MNPVANERGLSARNLFGRRTNSHVRTAAEADGVEARIRHCIDFMRQHLHQPLQVAALAARAGASPSHFFVLFKRVTGSPPIDYFIRMRMQHACELLQASAMPIKDVAAAVGYADPLYFSRVFKSLLRVPPTTYRALRESISSPLSSSISIRTPPHAELTNAANQIQEISPQPPP